MERFKISLLIALFSALLAISVRGQISTACTSTVITSFTPCINFITGSSNNGTSPTSNCCNSFKSLMSSSVDCACLVITANIPVQLPIIRALAIILPQACNMSGLPTQCKASGTPLPAPGPVLFAPPPPAADSPLSPHASKAVAQAPAPLSDFTPSTEAAASPTVEAEAPPTTAEIRPVLTPTSTSAASASYVVSPPSFLLMFIAVRIMQFY